MEMEIHNSKKVKLLSNANESDEISKLCDNLLIRILSFLSYKEAVRNSVISRTWQHLWKYFSGSLCFKRVEPTPTHSDSPSNLDWPNVKALKWRRKFVQWLNDCLDSHQAQTIEEFRVYHNLNKNFKRYVDEWVGFALRKKVKKLELNFAPEAWSGCYDTIHDTNESDERYFLTKETFSNGLSGFHFLTTLSFTYVVISDEILEYICSSFPLLESLELICCSPQLIHPTVSALRLKHLNVCCNYFPLLSIEIHAPNLVSFEYVGVTIALHIKYAPKLVQVHYDDISNWVIPSLSTVLADYLPQLVSLSIGTSNVGVSPGFPKLTSLKRLRCEALAANVNTMRCLISLIEAAPFLQKFELVVRAIGNERVKKINESELDVMWTRMREHPNKHIKEVEMVDFRAGEAHAEILSYLLKNAVMLEKLVIDTSRVFLGKGHYRALSRGCRYRKMQVARDIINQLMQKRRVPHLVLK